MHSIYNPRFVASLKYVPVPVQPTCANCGVSRWTIPHSGNQLTPGYLWCITRQKSVYKDDPPCPHYVPPQKKHTLRVEVCWRDRITGIEHKD